MQDAHCLIRVRRDHIIKDVSDQLTALSGSFTTRGGQLHLELRKPLKVQFAGEEGEDAGGLKKEFFQVTTEKLFSGDFGMFTYDESTHFHWFRGQCQVLLISRANRGTEHCQRELIPLSERVV